MKRKQKNNSSSTKRPPFVSSLKLSKLCKWLTLAVMMKLVILTTLLADVSHWELPFMLPISSNEVAVQPANKELSADSATAAESKQAISLPGTAAMAAEPAPAPAGDSLTREALAAKQDELNRKEQDLMRIQQEINQKLERLQALESRLKNMLEEADNAKDKKMRHLVDVYSNMKAKQAAQVLETLDEKIAVRILAGMRGRQAGEILTFVKAAKAARLSEALTKLQLPFE